MKKQILTSLLILIFCVGCGRMADEDIKAIPPNTEYEIKQYVNYVGDSVFYLSTYAYINGKVGYSTHTDYVHIDSLSKVKTKDSLLVVKVMAILKDKGLKF